MAICGLPSPGEMHLRSAHGVDLPTEYPWEFGKRMRKCVALCCMAGSAAIAAPTITQQPSSATVVQNASFSLSVSATGTGTLAYQWSFNGQPIYGATGASFGETNSQPGEAGSYSVTITDSTGSVTSSTATLAVLQEPGLPFPGWNSNLYVSEGGTLFAQSLAYVPSNILVTQWYKDGVPDAQVSEAGPEIEVNAGPTSSGTYAEVGGNASGQYGGYPSTFYFEPSAPSNPWLASSVQGNIAYFLFASPPQVQRYDMAAQAWLPTVNLAQTPTAILAEPEGVYIAFGRTTSLYSLDLSASQALTNTTEATNGIVANTTYVFLIGGGADNNYTGVFTPINRSTLQAGNPTTLGTYTAPIDPVLSTATGLIYGWNYGTQVVFSVTPNADGSVSDPNGISGSVAEESYVTNPIVVSPDGSKLIVYWGGVFNTSGLTPTISLGLPIVDACYMPDSSPVAVRNLTVTLYEASTYFEVGTVALSSQAEKVYGYGSTVFAFTPPASAGGAIAVSTIPEASFALSPRTPFAALSPTQCAQVGLAPDDGFLGNDGIVYLLDRPIGQILRWSPSLGSYLPSIPLTGIPFAMSYSPELNRIYLSYGDKRINEINLSNSTTEAPFSVLPTVPQGIGAAGSELWVAATNIQESGNLPELLDQNGNIIATGYLGYPDLHPTWSPGGQVLYFDSGGYLDYETLQGGVFGASTSAPYSSEGYAQPLRFNATGTEFVDGQGIVYNASTFAQEGTLASSVVDAAWIGSNIYSIGVDPSNNLTLFTVWNSPSYLSAGATHLPGYPLRLFALSSTQLLAITEQPTGPMFMVLDLSGNVISKTEGDAALFQEPVITAEPTNTTIANGGTGSVTVGAAGSEITYKWYNQSSQVVGTGPTLTFSNATSLDDGIYWASAFAYGYGVQAYPVQVTVAAPPAFTVQPQSWSVGQGSYVSFGVVTASAPGVTYQWYLNGSPISGATQSSISFSDVQPSNAGIYTVVATNSYGSSTSSAAVLTVTVLPAAPHITSQPVSVTVNQGASVSFSVTANGTPAPTYQWYYNNVGIPGATSATYSIASATLSQAGSYYVLVSNSQGSVQSATATLTETAQVSTAIITGPQSQSVQAGANVTFSAAASGSGTLSYQWSYNGSAIAGATASSYTIDGVQPSQSGNYTVTVTGPGGSATAGAVLAVSGATGSPVLQSQPQSQTIQSGRTVVFYVSSSDVTNTGASVRASSSTSYQWYLNGIAISGATNSTLLVPGATTASAGTYSCLVTNASGSTLSSSASLVVVAGSDPGRLIDVSCRLQVGTGAGVLIAGFVSGGSGTSGTQNLLIRGSGPALTQFNVSGVLPDPQLQLFESNSNGTSTLLATNDGWQGAASIAAAAQTVGAFAWTSASSHDSALLETLASGPYTAQIAGQSGDTGVALAEVYDATPSGTYTLASPRIINISARAQVGTGGNILIAGFVIGGSTSTTVLIRGSGPALNAFGVPGVLPDPQLQLYRSNSDGTSTLLTSDNGWGGNAQIATVASDVGAFAWSTSATPDSALLLTLPPGAYTAQVSGASGDTGVALVEVYEVP